VNNPRFPLSPGDLLATPAGGAVLSQASASARAASIGAAPVRAGLLAGARGVVISGAGAFGMVGGVVAALTRQGAQVALGCEAFDDQAVSTGPGILRLPVGDGRGSWDLGPVFAHIGDLWGGIDFLVHCAGPLDERAGWGRYVDMDARAFRAVMEGCVHAFAAITRQAAPLMAPGGSLLSLNCPAMDTAAPRHSAFEVTRAAQAASVRCLAEELGQQGLRVNAIAAGPLGSAAPVARARQPLAAHRAPLRRDVTADEIGKAAVYLLSDLASGTTGETLHVDAGHHAIGLRGVPPPVTPGSMHNPAPCPPQTPVPPNKG
jgi:enoyl-[acyl-carrier protein] reductase I